MQLPDPTEWVSTDALNSQGPLSASPAPGVGGGVTTAAALTPASLCTRCTLKVV